MTRPPKVVFQVHMSLGFASITVRADGRPTRSFERVHSMKGPATVPLPVSVVRSPVAERSIYIIADTVALGVGSIRSCGTSMGAVVATITAVRRRGVAPRLVRRRVLGVLGAGSYRSYLERVAGYH